MNSNSNTKFVDFIFRECFMLQWKAHEGLILSVAWNANNNLILSGAEDGFSKV